MNDIAQRNPVNIAVIDMETLIVENVVYAYDDYAVEGKLCVVSDVAGIGDIWDEVSGEFVRPDPEPEPLPGEEAYQAALETHVDAVASEKRYGGAVAIATYSNSTIPQWKAEAETFIAWRDRVYVYAIAELAKVTNGEREQPTVAEFIAELEVIEWPV